MRTAAVRRSVVFAVLAACWLNAGDGADSRLNELSRRAMKALGEQDYMAANSLLREGSSLARRAGELRRAALFENAICGTHFFAMQYGESLRACAEAISLAKAAGVPEVAGVAEYNRSNFLFHLGDWNGARIGFENSLGWLPSGSVHRIYTLTALGTLEMRQKKLSEARRAINAALDMAATSPDRRAEAYAWSVLGELEMRDGRLDAAEQALLAAFRLRKLHKLSQLESTWTQLGYLELARGRPEKALNNFTHGLEARRTSKASFTSFVTAHGRAKALGLLGRKREARMAYRQAFAESSAWRNEMAPSEGIEVAADVRMSEIISGFVRLCEEGQFEETWEAFQQLESMRAAGLRRQILINRMLAGKLSRQHAELIRNARQQALKALRSEPGAVEALRLAEAKLTKLEAETLRLPADGGSSANTGVSVERLRRSQTGGEVLISFWAGDRASRIWVVTRRGRATALLPGSAELARLAEAQRNAIKRGQGQAESAELFRVLFNRIPKALLSGERWIVVADGPLWSVAWGALRPEAPDGERYLIQRKTLEFLPSAAWLTQRSPAPETPLMVAAGDAIHNRADPRLVHTAVAGSAVPLSFWVWPRPRPEPGPAPLELPTLAGSRRETESVCEVWGAADCRTVRGVELTADRLASELSRRPAVLHLATHLVEDADPADSQDREAFLALSLNSKLEREGYRTAGVSRLQAPGALIVMSACGSVKGRVLPGAGLQGFGRAWLAAGARGTIGTLWAVPDSDGEFFKNFYRQLRGGASPASALRASQIRAIEEGGSRSLPKYWAAYTMIGKD